jgi:hypothetical protein
MHRKTIALLTSALLFGALLIVMSIGAPAAAIPEYGPGTPTVTIVMTPERSANIVAGEPDTAHGNPEFLLVTWDGSTNTGYALQYYNLSAFNRYGILNATMTITVSQENAEAFPAGFYICRTTYEWDIYDTWNTHDARCITPKVAFTATENTVYTVDVTEMVQLATVTNRGFQFR